MLHLELEMILHVSDKYINYAWQTLYLSNVNWKKIWEENKNYKNNIKEKQPLFFKYIKAVFKTYLLNISLSAFAGKNLTF